MEKIFFMAKLTKVLGAILSFVGSVILLYSFFVYLNTSAHLNYNVAKQPSIIDVHMVYPFLIGFITLVFGILFVNDKVLSNKH